MQTTELLKDNLKESGIIIPNNITEMNKDQVDSYTKKILKDLTELEKINTEEQLCKKQLCKEQLCKAQQQNIYKIFLKSYITLIKNGVDVDNILLELVKHEDIIDNGDYIIDKYKLQIFNKTT